MAASAPLKDYRNRSFRGEDLRGRDFKDCDLRGCDFTYADLQGVDFSGSTFGQTAQQRIKLIAVDAVATVTVTAIGASAVAGTTFNFTSAAFAFAFAFAVVIAAVAIAGATFAFDVTALAFAVIAFVGATAPTAATAAGATATVAIAVQVFSAFVKGSFLEGLLLLIVAVFFAFLTFKFSESAIYDIRNAPGTRFGGADLTDAIFVNTKLDNCDFNRAVLRQVNWTGAVVKRSSITFDPTMALLIHRKGNGGDYHDEDFSDLHMVGINLTKAVLNNSNLSRANLQHAVFQDVNLVSVQANGTDFRHATLTGACIQKWGINTDTQFDDVICDHIFLTPDRDPRSRRPLSGSFELGDFELLVDNFAGTLDFILRRGTDPIAFKQALNQFKRDNPEAQIKAMLELDVDRVLVQATVPEGSDTVKIHADFHATLQLKEQEIRHLTGTIADRDQTIRAPRLIDFGLIEVLNKTVCGEDMTIAGDEARIITTGMTE